MKQRITHIYQHNGPQPDWNTVPRGWITSNGRFLKTKEHWISIRSQFRKPEYRAKPRQDTIEETSEGERNSQLAYKLGWISVGHGGALNAIAHERTFLLLNQPAVITLRKLLIETPHVSISIETQIGEFDPSSGKHEDFQVKDYDLDILIKRGRLRQRLPDSGS